MLADIVPLMSKKDNVEIEVLVLSDKNNIFHDKLVNEKIKVVYSNIKHLYNPGHIFAIRNIIKRNNYDVVHVHLFPSIYWVAIAYKLLPSRYRPKFIMTEHSTHNKRRDKKYFRPIEKFIYSHYDKIISISKETKFNLIDWINEKNINKHFVIENGIEINRYKNAKPYSKQDINRDFNKETKLLCMVGRFSEQKDQLTVIKALKSLDDSIHLLLVGEGKLKEQHIRFAKDNNLQNRVHFLGFRSDVERIMKTVDIIILSSHWEGFGLVAAEGMATGKPVIASDVAGLRNVVNDAGVLFAKGDYEQLAIEIIKLLNNKEHYNDISLKCFRKSNEYDINRVVKKYLREYIKMLWY